MAGERSIEPAGAPVELPPPVDARRAAAEQRYFDSQGNPDPCPVIPLGHALRIYHFISPSGEYLSLSSRDLYGRGGIASLFNGDLDWCTRQFPTYGEDGKPKKHPNLVAVANALIQDCVDAGYFDGNVSMHGVGIWLGPERSVIVHVGDRLAVLDRWTRDARGALEPPRLTWRKPGEMIGGALYRQAGATPAPATEGGEDDAGPLFSRLRPALPDTGELVVAHFERWNHAHGRAQAMLLAGAVASMMLGGLPAWRANLFLLGQPGGGKSTLMDSIGAILGGAAHKTASNYSEAYIRQRGNGEARAMLLDEADSPAARQRLAMVVDLIRSMTGGAGARGGRGSAGGQAQSFELIAPVVMAANTHDPLRPADAQRITRLRLLPIASDQDEAAMLEEREEIAPQSGELRARMLWLWPVWRDNFALAKRLLSAAGAQYHRQVDQLGYFAAGYWTLTGDHPRLASEVEVGWLEPWLEDMSSPDEADPHECLQHLFSWSADFWRSGHRVTVGQLVMWARGNEGWDARRALGTVGLRLMPESETGPVDWSLAPLAIANKHAGLDPVYRGTDWDNRRWSQVLADLQGARHDRTRFAGAQARCVLVGPEWLPAVEAAPPAPPAGADYGAIG